jgi:hypothetical protein
MLQRKCACAAGCLFRALPGNNDTINSPDSHASYAMQL